MRRHARKTQTAIWKLLSLALAAAMLLSLLSLPVYAADSSIPVTQKSVITSALALATDGDVLTFVFGTDISLDSSLDGCGGIVIPEGVTAIFTNQSDADVTVTRAYDLFGFPFSPMVTVKGKLILQNNAGGGSITLSGGDANFVDQPMLAVDGSFVMNSGTITQCRSFCGPAISGSADSSVTINGGELSHNNAISLSANVKGTGLGGAVYTLGALNVTGGIFSANWAANIGGAVYACGDTVVSGGSFSDNVGALGGGALLYNGDAETLLEITGGSFTDNKVTDGLFGGGIYVDEGYARITGGIFADNAAPGFGGGIYVDEGAEVQMQNVSVYSNAASGFGGGIFNCATGGGDYQRFCGMTLYGNTATAAGADFYSDTKHDQSNNDRQVYVSRYTANGSEIEWYKDVQGSRYAAGDAPADSAYYQDSFVEIALKSGASLADLTASVALGRVQVYGNSAVAGAGIANNGILYVGYSGLVIEKQVTGEGARPDDVFVFTVLFSDGKTYGGVENGGLVMLKAGEKKAITEIPEGITVTVIERNMKNYYADNREQTALMGEHDTTLVFVNRYVAPQPETSSVTFSQPTVSQPKSTSVTVTKRWAGDTNGKQPDAVQVQLYNGTRAVGSPVTLNAGNQWRYTFTDLDADGAWTVDEVGVPAGYTKTVAGNAAAGFTVTNTYTATPESSAESLVDINVSVPQLGGGAGVPSWIAVTAILVGFAGLGIGAAIDNRRSRRRNEN